MSIIRIEDIAHVRFTAPDLVEMRRFLNDFGLICEEVGGRLYARGEDGRAFLHVTEPGEPGFRAVGLRAETVEDLQRLAAAEGVPVEPITEPGGGWIVRLRDPDGFGVEVVAGQKWNAPGPPFADPPRNTSNQRSRFGELVRLSADPAHVHRIGHCVLNVSDFRKSEAWYKDPASASSPPTKSRRRPGPRSARSCAAIAAKRPTDHHTLFLAQLPQKPGFLHAAFEVANFDDLMLGHQHLRGEEAHPGLGRRAPHHGQPDIRLLERPLGP